MARPHIQPKKQGNKDSRRSGGGWGWEKIQKIGTKQYRRGLHKIGGLGTLHNYFVSGELA